MGVTIVNSAGDAGAPDNLNMYCEADHQGKFGYPENV